MSLYFPLNGMIEKYLGVDSNAVNSLLNSSYVSTSSTLKYVITAGLLFLIFFGAPSTIILFTIIILGQDLLVRYSKATLLINYISFRRS